MATNLIGRALRNRRAGHDALVWTRPELVAPTSFVLTSSAFAHDGPMPERYRGRFRAPNISPPLSWSTPPDGTRELVLVVEDPDAPMSRPAVHVLVAGIDPSAGGIPEHGLRHPSPVRGIRFGKGLLGRRGYAGPLPPRSHGPHAYVFQLFALDAPLALADGFGRDELVAAMAGHVLGRSRLDGTFERR